MTEDYDSSTHAMTVRSPARSSKGSSKGSSIGDKKQIGTSQNGDGIIHNNNKRTGKMQGLLKTEGLSSTQIGQSIKFSTSVDASNGTVQKLHDSDRETRNSVESASGMVYDMDNLHNRARKKRKRVKDQPRRRPRCRTSPKRHHHHQNHHRSRNMPLNMHNRPHS